jgi:glycosyltransferase involved in cell wall biosynthesis
MAQIGAREGFSLVYKDGLLLGPEWCRRFEWVHVLAPYYQEEGARIGLKTDKWFVIPHFVDTERFAPVSDRLHARSSVLGEAVPDDSLIVLAVGDFAPESNKRLVWIISELLSLGPSANIHLVLAGQATSSQMRQLQLHCRPLGNRVHLRPNTSPQQMSDLYRAADVFVHAALREPFGLVLIEALSTGLPVVCHPFPVTQWIVGKGGTSVDMTVPGELACVLDRWRREPNLRRDLGAAARDRATSTFTAERIIPLYRQFYAAIRAR